MTDEQLFAYFQDRALPTGRITFSAFESTQDCALMVKLAIERIQNRVQGADTSRQVLERLIAYLEKPPVEG